MSNKTIESVDKNSPAKKAGLKPNDIIKSINNEPVLDFIDDNYFNSLSDLEINYIRKGKKKLIIINKDHDEPLGINYKEDLYPSDRQCANACVFCFVHQLPKGMRESLYIKDDDWRYSVLFGNYVTLTNVFEKEFKRIVKRKASPLYVSVHAVDGKVRSDMMLGINAEKIKEQLGYLAKNKIIVHSQVVLCPGINDEQVLTETIEYLYSLYPYVRSLAVVPVGLTRHRNNLPDLKHVDELIAKDIINIITSYNIKYQIEKGINFVFASDEFYSKAKLPYPMYEGGEHYPQLSNGVGMFSELNSEFENAHKLYKGDITQIESDKKIALITGVSAYKKISSMVNSISDKAEKLNIQIYKIKNTHFGDSITVAGLLCGADIVSQLKNIVSDVIIVPASTLKDGRDVFLDDINVEYIEKHLSAKVIVQDIDGYSLIETIIKETSKG